MPNGLTIHLHGKGGKVIATRILDWQAVLGEMAAQLGAVATLPEQAKPQAPAMPHPAPAHRDFLTIPEIAERWRIARPTVYNRLRSARVKVLDFATHTGRGRKLVPVGEILKIEGQQFKRL